MSLHAVPPARVDTCLAGRCIYHRRPMSRVIHRGRHADSRARSRARPARSAFDRDIATSYGARTVPWPAAGRKRGADGDLGGYRNASRRARRRSGSAPVACRVNRTSGPAPLPAGSPDRPPGSPRSLRDRSSGTYTRPAARTVARRAHRDIATSSVARTLRARDRARIAPGSRPKSGLREVIHRGAA